MSFASELYILHSALSEIVSLVSYCFCILSELQKFLTGKADAYKDLICIM